MIVALTGFMASGKSYFGRKAARRCGLHFADLDLEMAERSGYGSVNAIVSHEGMETFRAFETEVLSQLLGEERDMLLSLGGGTVLAPANREMLRQRARVIWLDTDLEVIMMRMNPAIRPVAAGKSRQELEELYGERRPVYEACADAVLHIGADDSADDIVQRLAALVSSFI